MNDIPKIISYRSPDDSASRFLNVHELLKKGDLKEMKKVYTNIFRSITAYEASHADSLIKVENAIYNKIERLEQRILAKEDKSGWKSVLASAATLGMKPLTLYIKRQRVRSDIHKLENIHKAFHRSIGQMKRRALEKAIHSKPDAIKRLESVRLSDTKMELKRLKTYPRIAHSLQMVKHLNMSEDMQVAYGHSLELQEALKETHYVINHGQNIPLMLLNIVARQLTNEFNPDRYESFEPLRHETALRHIAKDSQTCAWFQAALSQKGVTDSAFRRELICGDCFLESTDAGESALFYFAQGINVAAQEPSFVKKVLLTIIQDYVTDPKIAKKLCDDLMNLTFNQAHKGGNLYSICVPKERLMRAVIFLMLMAMPMKIKSNSKVG